MLERSISKAGWTRTTLGQVAINSTVATTEPKLDGFVRYIIGKHIPGDGQKINTWNEVGDGEFGSRIRTIIKEGDIVCTTRGPNLRVGIAAFDCLSAHTNFILRTSDPNLLMQEYLQGVICSEQFQDHLRRNFRGSTNLFVNWSDAATFEFQLPPIQEQARLVEALSAYRNAEEALGVAADNLATTRSAYISHAIGLSRAAADTVPVGSLLLDGPTNGRSPAPSDSLTGFKTVSISAIRDGIFDPEGCIKFIDMTPADAAQFTVQAGDIFAVRGNGNRDICGRVGISRETYPDLIYPDLLIRMRFDPSRLLPDLVVAQWNHPTVHSRLISRAKSSNGIWKVNGQDIRAHTLVVPPMEAQREAVQFLGALDVQAAAIHSRLAALRDMKRDLFKTISGGDE